MTKNVAKSKQSEKSNRAQWNVVSVFAILLSLCALLVSVIEVSAIRDEQRIQVWPFLQLSSQYGPEGYRILLKNKGIGPARVKSLAVLNDGQVATDIDTLISTLVGEEKAFSYDVYEINEPAPGVLSPDEVVVLFAVPWDVAEKNADTRLFVKRWNEVGSVRACYCSVYDECWLAELNQGEPEAIDACPVVP
ncbi:MAG: hypothetical protein AAF438_21915 [Pseudomonadota bacterium]